MSKFDDLTLKDVKELRCLLGEPKKQTDCCPVDHGKNIVVLQRGWVLVGDLTQTGTQCVLSNASVIRRWGTTKGLGEIAENGPTKDTILDPAPGAKYHELTAVVTIPCRADKWKNK